MQHRLMLVTALVTGIGTGLCVHAKSADHSHHQPMYGETPKVSWTEAPLLALNKGRSRSVKNIRLHNLNAEQITVYPPGAEESWKVDVQNATVNVKSRGGTQGGYHWVGVESENNNLVQSVASVIYFSNPGPAPRGMLNLQKTSLDISPLELPREHRHFRAGENWNFRVNLHGKPLVDVPVIFETGNQTRKVLKTDKNGLIQVTFPFDFPDAEETSGKHAQGHAHGRRRQSDFVLSVEQVEDQRKYMSHFNYHYTTGAFYNKNLVLGIGFAVFGMITAAPLLRKSKKGVKA